MNILSLIGEKMNVKDFLKKHSLEIGDLIEINLSKGSFEGFVIPSDNENILALKALNGYNAGFALNDVKEVKKKKEKRKIGKPEPKKIEFNPNKPTISILHTGGTIASRINYSTGGVFASFNAEDLITLFPEITEIANIKTELISSMMSEDMRFENHQLMAKAIEKQVKNNVKGIIIGHGTDTLGYTAAALSFMLEGINIPVILVGAQRSSDRGASDAAINLICAAEFISKTDFAGVAICMHETTSDENCVILPGTNTRKLHTSRRDAFKAVNSKPIARINFQSREIQYLSENYSKKNEKNRLKVLDKMEEKVAIIRSYTNFDPILLDTLRKHNYKGLVFEITGLGQGPINTKENAGNEKALKELIESGCIVVVTSQCIFGRVHPYAYTNCRRLVNLGVIFGEDMLTETAFLKLAWLLGNYSKEEAKKLITENLRGEISKCSDIEFPID